MNEFDRADINTARRLRNEQQLRCNVIFTSDDQLLLVTAGKRTRRQCCVWWTNVKALNDLSGASLHGVLVEKNPTHVRGDRRTIMNAEDRVLSQTEIEQEPASMTILRDVCDAELTPNARAE